ncbi:hypothetical protein EDD37DRAFT_74002 [Exophiala viscosa]|nr:hypothetical protein EDD37DRAFT_74002 [Exophiala viscosa]
MSSFLSRHSSTLTSLSSRLCNSSSLARQTISTTSRHFAPNTSSLRIVRMASTGPILDSNTISAITEKEKQLTGSDEPAKGGPTAQAQKHAGEPLNSNTISSITQGEKKIAGDRVAGGPTAAAQSILTKSNQQNNTGNRNNTSNNNNNNINNNAETSSASDGILHGDTISNIRKAESEITGLNQPAKGGPTAQAQKHTGEPITSQVLHDITEGEKSVSGQAQAISGGPTAQAQHDLAKSRE